ncbi:amidohydrolase family protein [Kallotenue papyrolyticum]|uniref:amidohydrolase family protein n=1 Tax=Kallotenue papyrolyticum TaxID=1325125 RepID=UPI000492A705|nr:amidohydrolase family protein [Kallotenue papyrolyticum]
MTILRLPGLIDVHVHLREPGGEHKEDYASGTAAALAGGITCVLDMPNTTPPTTTYARLMDKRQRACQGARCDVGIYAGASHDNLHELAAMAPAACGLKIYVNETFGPLRIDDATLLEQHIAAWPGPRPIVTHSEGDVLPLVLELAARHGQRLHIAHVATRREIELIVAAKERGQAVTCEVTPHHLFLSVEDRARLGPFGEVRPRLATPDDRAALWHYLDYIDCIATDHAPHTIAEKQSSTPPPGMPGLESSLPLMLTAVDEGRLTLERLIELMATNPARIFDLPIQPDTWVEVEIGPRERFGARPLHTRCGWTPFADLELAGRVRRTVLRGVEVFDGERVLAAPGSGRVLFGTAA